MTIGSTLAALALVAAAISPNKEIFVVALVATQIAANSVQYGLPSPFSSSSAPMSPIQKLHGRLGALLRQHELVTENGWSVLGGIL